MSELEVSSAVNKMSFINIAGFSFDLLVAACVLTITFQKAELGNVWYMCH